MILRGLWERRALSLIVLLIAIVPIASAAVGPLYSAAARTTIVRDAIASAPVEGRGWRYTTTRGDLPARLAAFTAGTDLTAPPIFGMETNSGRPGDKLSYPIMWQGGQCEHLKRVAGRCPTATKELMASRTSGFKVGDEILLSSIVTTQPGGITFVPAPLQVVGLYEPISAADPFWFGRTLFDTGGEPGGERTDPLFTVPQTRYDTYAINAGNAKGEGWTDYGIVYLDPRRLTGSDVGTLTRMQATAEAVGRDSDAIVFSYLADTLKAITTQTGSLGVPTLLVIAQLVGLGWLLLFQTVGDLVRARAPEIALARLRGHGRIRVWLFALAEPLLVLAAAVPLGLALGRGAAGLMVGALLPAGIPVDIPPEALWAGAAATLGGVLAAALAAYRTATRPIIEEWRRTPRRSARGWVLDAVVLAVTAIGLVELLATGVITDVSGQSSSALAVPGLMALGVALLAGRALPVLSGRLFPVTRRHGGIGPFLALRQVARGPVTAGSVIVLGTAFGLATFAVSAWTATQGDYRAVAAFHNGAATALTIQPVEPRALAAALDEIDPAATLAAPVIKLPGPPQLVATDPVRLAMVGHWQPELAGGTSLAKAAAGLSGPRTPRVWVRGDRFRLSLSHGPPPKSYTARLLVTLRIPGGPQPVAIPLGQLRGDEGGDYAWNLPPACARAACELRAVHGELIGPQNLETTPFLPVKVTGLAVRDAGVWNTLDTPTWRVDDDPDENDGRFTISTIGNQTLRPATYGAEIPAIVVGPVGRRLLPGLDQAFAVPAKQVAAAAAAPGLDAHGVLVDLEEADRIAYGVHPKATYEVWTTATDTTALERALREQGITVVSARHMDDLVASYAGEGPGLALMLLLVSALAAAVLALGRTVLALHTAARRRGYELAALEASGARVAALRSSLLLEQVLTMAVGTLAGLAAGLLAARVALSRVPQFAQPPVTPPLPHEVAPEPVALVIGAALLASLLAAAVVSELLLRGIKVERLRDQP
ncbi:FtsX-like permease family protein [Nonomuraea sp. NPDC048916]|uniref:FtsX-like permease family protein n=1 Tax=Nonomuraea sp. NPDC048916 TaxID=3154232 RepID=UPI0033E07F9D